MSQQMLEIVILAAVAVVVVARLLSVLGQRRGAEPPPQPAPVEVGAGSVGAPTQAPTVPTYSGPPGVAGVMQADPGFDPALFIVGARSAYEAIVAAFAAGDRAALQPLLNPRVYETYARAIEEREGTGAKGADLVRLKTAEIVDARMEGDIARVSVRFEAELAEGAYGLRETRERWTFERDVRSRDPNWRLSSVSQA